MNLLSLLCLYLLFIYLFCVCYTKEDILNNVLVNPFLALYWIGTGALKLEKVYESRPYVTLDYKAYYSEIEFWYIYIYIYSWNMIFT